MLSVVVPTYKGKDILKKTLRHNLDKLAAYSFEYIVVDDGCLDDTVPFLKEAFPEVTIVALETNLGFSGACNAGVAAASHENILLLNNDMLIHDLNLDPILAYLQEDAVFSVSPKIVRTGQETFNESVSAACFKGGYFKMGHISLLKEHYQAKEKEPILWSCGGAMFCLKQRYQEVGGMDEVLLPSFYYEDVDICYRAWLRGWGSYYTDHGYFEHFHKQTSNTFSSKFIENMAKRNMYLVTWKSIRDPLYLTWHILAILLRFLTLQFSEMRVIFLALMKMPDVVREARKTKRLRSDREVLAHFDYYKHYVS